MIDTDILEYLDDMNHMLETYLRDEDYENANLINYSMNTVAIQLDWEIEYVMGMESYP